MNEWIQALWLLISAIVCTIALIPVAKKWKTTRIQLHKGLLIFLIVFDVSFVFRIYFALQPIIYPSGSQMIFGAGLTPVRLFAIFIQVTQLWFLCYGMIWKKWYTFPFVLGFFVIAGYIFIDSSLPIIILGAFVAFLSFPILLRKGIKNRDGYLFSIGLACVVFLISFSFSAVPEINLGLAPLGFFILALGTYGWFDEKVFYDKVKEYQVKHTWLSTRIA
jgi:hypothetical protein